MLSLCESEKLECATEEDGPRGEVGRDVNVMIRMMMAYGQIERWGARSEKSIYFHQLLARSRAFSFEIFG